MEFNEALDHLDALINYEKTPRAGKVEGLSIDPMVELMALLGDPHTAYPVIHVTGTNGKGSTVRMIEALLKAMGLRVGTYTSPHLESVTERVRLEGENVTEASFGEAVGDVVRAVEAHGLEAPTWFETVTASALLVFANEAVDVAVVEVGMLGRYDATNVVDAQVAVVTNVGRDHTSGDGDWRHEIASEKAGIIKPQSIAVIGEPDPELQKIFTAEVAAGFQLVDQDFAVVEDQLAVGGRLVSMRTPNGAFDDVFVAQHGSHQATNAAIAVAATEAFFDAALPDDVVQEAMGTLVIPGRLEVVGTDPLVLIDAAHNPPGADAFAEAVSEEFPRLGRRLLIWGMQDGRDPKEMAEALRLVDYQLVITTTAPTPRGVPAEVLADAVRALGGSADAVADVEAAFDHALNQADDDDLIAVVGSHPVVGHIRALAREN